MSARLLGVVTGFVGADISQPVSDVFAAVLKFFHHDVGVPWGLAIVLLAVLIRLCLLPTDIRQFRGRPGVSPLSWCLPLLIQWPFLIGLILTLRGKLRDDICPTIQTAYQTTYAHVHHLTLSSTSGQTTTCGGKDGSGFLFVHDLTNVPHGVALSVLLILAFGISIGSGLSVTAAAWGRTQGYLMLALPLVFALIIVGFPAGALVFYIAFNGWSVVQHLVLREVIARPLVQRFAQAVGMDGDEESPDSGGPLTDLFGPEPESDEDD